MQLYFTTTSPHYWVVRDSRQLISSGTADDLDGLPLDKRYDRIVAIVPGEKLVTRSISLPVRNRQRLLSAVPFAIEESLAAPIEDLYFAILHAERGGEVHFAYVARKDRQAWLDAFGQAGIHVGSILPDYLLLPCPEPSAVTLVETTDGRLLARTGPFQGAVVEESGFDVWLKETGSAGGWLIDGPALEDRLEKAGIKALMSRKPGRTLVEWLEDPDNTPGPGIPAGGDSTDSNAALMKRYRPAAFVAAVALLTYLAADLVELNWLSRTRADIEKKMEASFHELFPGARLVAGKVRVQLKNRIEALNHKRDGNVLVMLLTSAGKRLRESGVRIEELQFRDGQLMVVCTMRDFSHLDAVKQALNDDSSLDVRLIRSGARGSRVQAQFEFRLHDA